ncbi:hypothetical protein A2634_02930 [Candidatus Amesbacteria bacterium RIFCSPHIGHO2_01_FULL_48_32]|uniref:Plasmid stabilization protein n=1 Tax=Candidatus Amesbacteria bacterium RIFCSPLOWO2_01_FULL_48_25 TaxID=1797259 RepID=A0A1F4ZB18_9BACT|nr:MAG: hypothetical protein A2634_02930 [Candidatus Amesbacteria bacterium RIFCSPHIGHO2_01_FULL_48_32]OGD03096.1 MAG: hypothetical protein A2989_02150 [Candidatus Amesbacteria bacterium RIFCSPLOWO2_01_FULL_48_25]
MYQITLKSQVENFLIKKLDRKTQIKISAKIDTLARDPFAPTNLDKLSGMSRGYRLRIGNTRVVYEIDTPSKTVIIWKIDWRSSIYRP